MSRTHVLIAVGLLANGACAAARQPSRDPASTGVATEGEVGAPRATAGGGRESSREHARVASREPEAVVDGEDADGEPGAFEGEPRVPQNLLEAVVACRRVQDDRELPVGCSTEFIDGMLTMMVGFESALDAAKYSGDLEAQLSMPFCEAANGAGTSALVYVLVANSARKFNCELGQWGAWFDLVADPERAVESPN